MKLNELKKDPLKTIQYHDTLNPAVWDGFEMKPEVRSQLLKIAMAFMEFLVIPNIKVLDVIVTGSNANYNWTKLSDIDLHLVVNFDKLRSACPELLEDYFNAKKRIWNDTRDIKIYGFPVELYVEDINDAAVTLGEFSVIENEWNRKPQRQNPSIDHYEVKKKLKYVMNLIDSLPPCSNSKALERFRDKVWEMRKAGLDKSGEFSVENVVFKALRNTGYIDKILNCYNQAVDSELSLD